ncbi:MAG TPA: hypothetical protein VGD65_21580 [Chryseosolibacter sp.]
MMCHNSKLIFVILLSFANCAEVQAQSADTVSKSDDIMVLSRVSPDSITLRWAPVSYELWRLGNSNGYTVERFTLVRGNEVIPPERKLLTAEPLRPDPLNQWQHVINKSRYHAIAAQALFGDDFAVDLARSDVMSIANKVKENDQRFSFALWCADMSRDVAQKSALLISDTAIRADERYLYRVSINSLNKVSQGSGFVSPDDSAVLVPPGKLKCEVGDRLVTLKWQSVQRMRYAFFQVERSADSVNFETVSEIPFVTLEPTADSSLGLHSVSDSIPAGKELLYYRVRGVNAFGDTSAVSNIAVATVERGLNAVPRIAEIFSADNKAITVSWDFPRPLNSDLAGFEIERGESERTVRPLPSLPLVGPTQRSFIDHSPLPVNYYRVTAIHKSGKRFPSFTQLALLVDSLPPAAPEELRAVVNESGRVELTWKKNTEGDLYGYRVYKSNHGQEELAQITSAPIPITEIADQVDLRTLNKFVFYSVIAVDKNQNESKLSARLKVKLPDKVKPVAPVMLPALVDSLGVTVRWQHSSSKDVKHYEVYRAREDYNQWVRIKILPASTDSLGQFYDMLQDAKHRYRYSIVAVDSSNNESLRASPIIIKCISHRLPRQVTWRQWEVDRESKRIILKWEYPIAGIKAFALFKAVDSDDFSLYKTLPVGNTHLAERIATGRICRYRIMAVFDDGRKSRISEQLELKF